MRNTYIHTYIQTDRQADRQTDTQTYRQTDTRTDIPNARIDTYMHKHMQKAHLCNPKRGLGAPPAWRTADDGTCLRMAALKPRHRGAAAGGWLGRNPVSMATHISLPVFKLTEKQTPT